jgi:hypothetical protein
MEFGLAIGSDALPATFGRVDIAQRALPVAMHTAAQVHQPPGSLDQGREQIRRQRVDSEHRRMALGRIAAARFYVDAGVVDDGIHPSAVISRTSSSESNRYALSTSSR